MKTILASLLLLGVIALICSPLFLIWFGLTVRIALVLRILVIMVGIILCYMVKPISVLTGKKIDI